MAIKRKKGMLYLSLAIVFVILISTIYLTHNAYRRTDKQAVITNRITTINDFVKDLNIDINRAAYISGFRALIGVEEYISQKGNFFSNQTSLEEAFRIIFLEGNYNGTTLTIMENSSFTDYLTRVQQQSKTIGILTNITITNVNLEQTSPWKIYITFIGTFNLSNADNQLWWSYDKNFTTEISIIGLKDPLYTINTLGRVPNTINTFTLPITGYVNDTNNDTTILQTFIEESYYQISLTAPSFLQRFTNNLTSSIYGIESIVYLPSFSDQGITIKNNRSVIDYIYFATATNSSADRCQIQNMIFLPDWFRMDLEHMDDYELDGLTSNLCP